MMAVPVALLLAGACALVLLIVLLWPLRLHLSLQGRGDPSGTWALGGGTELGPIALSCVGANTVPAMLHVHVFGKRILSRRISQTKKRASTTPLSKRYAQLTRFIDPVSLATFLIGEQRRLRIPELEIELDYSFADVTLTGTMMGAIYALDAMLPAPIEIRQRTSWDAEDRAALRASGTIVFRALPLMWDTLVFLARNVKIRRPKSALAPVGSTT